MQQMMAQMAEMKEEIDQLHGRPHKKTVKDEDMQNSTSSWSPVQSPITPGELGQQGLEDPDISSLSGTLETKDENLCPLTKSAPRFFNSIQCDVAASAF